MLVPLSFSWLRVWLVGAAPNDRARLVLHAEVGIGPCQLPLDPCASGATTQVSPGFVAPHLLLTSYDDVAGVQTAFEWDSWSYSFGLWDCQTNQITAHTPSGSGATLGTLTTSFDAITGGATTVIGRLGMIATNGKLRQVDSSFPGGTHVISQFGEQTPVVASSRGSIAVNQPGIDACPQQVAAIDSALASAMSGAGPDDLRRHPAIVTPVSRSPVAAPTTEPLRPSPAS